MLLMMKASGATLACPNSFSATLLDCGNLLSAILHLCFAVSHRKISGLSWKFLLYFPWACCMPFLCCLHSWEMRLVSAHHFSGSARHSQKTKQGKNIELTLLQGKNIELPTTQFCKQGQLFFQVPEIICVEVYLGDWREQLSLCLVLVLWKKKEALPKTRSFWITADCRGATVVDTAVARYLISFSDKSFSNIGVPCGMRNILFECWRLLNLMSESCRVDWYHIVCERQICVPFGHRLLSIFDSFVDWHCWAGGAVKTRRKTKQTYQPHSFSRARTQQK